MKRPARILVVDDEQDIRDLLGDFLESFGYEPALARDGAEALAKLSPRIDLVLLDVRMPGMDGFEVARQIRKNPKTGDIPIIMVTALRGKEDRLRAVRAGANDFIAKPVDVTELKVRTESLLKMKESQDAVKRQKAKLEKAYAAEKELLEKTLKGSVKILVEVLSLANPQAFSRASRLRRYVQQICAHLNLPNSWQYEIAAMLSQIGCVTVPPEILEKYFAGQALTPEEGKMIYSHPSVGSRLLANIPRLELVAEMVGKQNDFSSDSFYAGDLKNRSAVTIGAHILKAVIDYDNLVTKGGMTHRDAVNALKKPESGNDPLVLSALQNIYRDDAGEPVEFDIKTVELAQLETGMILGEDLLSRGKRGILLARQGQEVSEPLLARVRNYSSQGRATEPIRVFVPRQEIRPGNP